MAPKIENLPTLASLTRKRKQQLLDPGAFVGEALSTWSGTLRLCLVLIAASPITGVILAIVLLLRS